MIGPVVTGLPVVSPVLLIGQAPGVREGPAGKPFAWTAGKTMFGWFASLGLTEEQFRDRVYMAAVCRCFPGKAKGGGDRVPSPDEIARCSRHLTRDTTPTGHVNLVRLDDHIPCLPSRVQLSSGLDRSLVRQF